MHYVEAIIVSVIAVEVFLRLPIVSQVSETMKLAKKIFAVVGSRHISDHWKEKVLIRYAGGLALNSCKMALWLVALLISLYVVCAIFDRILGANGSIFDFLASAIGIIFVTAASVAYYNIRMRFA